MLKRWFWRWRYQRLPDKLYDRSTRNLTLLTRYCRFALCLSFNESDYRTRIQYQIATKTENIGELAALTGRIIELLRIDSPHVDRLFIQYEERRLRRLDIYLTDDDQVPVDEIVEFQRLLDAVLQLTEDLERIKKHKPSLYAYYNQSLRYYTHDVIDVVDAFISMQLGVSNGRRHAPTLVDGRQG